MERLLIARVLSAIGMLCQGRSLHLVRLGRRLGLKWKIRSSPSRAAVAGTENLWQPLALTSVCIVS